MAYLMHLRAYVRGFCMSFSRGRDTLQAELDAAEFEPDDRWSCRES